MNFFQAVKEAFSSLAANKMRSFLTVLGIVIGVGAVIAILSISRGLRRALSGKLSPLVRTSSMLCAVIARKTSKTPGISL